MFTPKRLVLLALATGFGLISNLASGDEIIPFDWQIEQVDRGTKPSLALDGADTPTIIYMLERINGWVKAAAWNGSDWDISTVQEGYFYGPLDVAFDGNDVPHISYHDHQDTRFMPEKGDAVHGFLQDGQWKTETLEHPGHDGWDNRLTVDAQNNVHISAMDPKDFGGQGVEYYFVDADGAFFVETIGSGPLTYQFATSIAVNPSGQPHITYYDEPAKSLKLATRTGVDDWTIETVDAQGDTGFFSSLVIDESGGVHISYFKRTDISSGHVRYAFRSDPDSAWQISQLDSLDNVFFGFTGARNITSLALDSMGRPWIAFSDEQTLRLAIFDGAQWRVQTVTDAGDNPLGQIVSLKLDAADTPHIAYATITNKRTLDGFILHATMVNP